MSKISVVSGRQPDDATQNDAEPCYVWNGWRADSFPKTVIELTHSGSLAHLNVVVAEFVREMASTSAKSDTISRGTPGWEQRLDASVQ